MQICLSTLPTKCDILSSQHLNVVTTSPYKIYKCAIYYVFDSLFSQFAQISLRAEEGVHNETFIELEVKMDKQGSFPNSWEDPNTIVGIFLAHR